MPKFKKFKCDILSNFQTILNIGHLPILFLKLETTAEGLLVLYREMIASKWDESKGLDGNLNSEKNQAICHLGLGRSSALARFMPVFSPASLFSSRGGDPCFHHRVIVGRRSREIHFLKGL